MAGPQPDCGESYAMDGSGWTLSPGREREALIDTGVPKTEVETGAAVAALMASRQIARV